MTHFVASMTLNSAKSCMMHGASCIKSKLSSVPFVFSIPFVLNWGGSISPDSFLSSILLLMVMVVIIVVTVILVVVVVAIIGVVIVVMITGVVVVDIVGGVPSIIKLSFVIIGCFSRTILIGQEPFQFSPGDFVGLLYSNRFNIGIPPGQGIFGESTSSILCSPRFGVDAAKEFKEKYAKCLMLLVKDLVLSSQDDNTDGDAAFDEKEPEFEGKKPDSKVNVSLSSSAQSKKHDDKTKREAKGKTPVNAAGTLVPAVGQIFPNSTNTFSAAGPSNVAASPTHGKSSLLAIGTSRKGESLTDKYTLNEQGELEDITYSSDEDDVGVEADFNNLETSIIVSPILTTKVHKDHHVTQIIGDLSSATQTRSMTRVAKDQGGLSQINNDDFHTCMLACFLSREEPKRKVWVLVDLQYGKRAIGIKWVFRNKKDERGIVVRNKARLVTQGHTQDEGIDYEEVFCSRFEDPDYPDKVYKVVKALYGLHQAPRAWYKTLANYLLENGFQRGKIDQTLFIKRLTDGKLASTPIDTEKPLMKDHDGEDVDVHTYRSMISSLMYLTSSRPDIMFTVCACVHFQVTPKALHLHAVKRIFRYLKDKPHLGLWYPKVSPFDLMANSDSDYAVLLGHQGITTASTTITAADVSITVVTTVAAPTLTTAPCRRTKGVVIRDLEESTTTSIIIHSEAKSKDKGKGILTKEQMDEEDSRVLKRLNETQEGKAAKTQKLDEEVEELKRHLQIVPNKEDDVYTEATPLSLKVPV
nr:hypothetical protein [Tanacetum cinerariifolium]